MMRSIVFRTSVYETEKIRSHKRISHCRPDDVRAWQVKEEL